MMKINLHFCTQTMTFYWLLGTYVYMKLVRTTYTPSINDRLHNMFSFSFYLYFSGLNILVTKLPPAPSVRLLHIPMSVITYNRFFTTEWFIFYFNDIVLVLPGKVSQPCDNQQLGGACKEGCPCNVKQNSLTSR
jgi:hypothetical protein